MKRFARTQYASSDIPDFLFKATIGCSLVVILILIPFAVNSFIQDRFIIGLATSSAIIVCAVNVWLGFHGRYSLLVNTYFVSITGAFSIIYTLIKLGSAGSYWPYLLCLVYYFVLPERRARFLNVLTLLITIPAAWVVLDQSLAIRFSAVLVGVSLFAYISMREINILHGRLREHAVTDKLTGLFNRTLMEASLQQAIAQNQRTGVPMTLITLDIDRFKPINDTLGHDTGDKVLKGLADLLGKSTRSSDMTFRAGGDEFIILVHNTDERQGTKVAEKLRQKVEQAALLPDRKVTISLGVSGLQEGMDVATWMKACDGKLYRAKESGRNRVVV